MKLLIDIPEKVVTAIQNGENYRYDIHTTIAQGIPYEERPQGKWICEDVLHHLYYCSECRNYGEYIQPFCAWCGAEMKKGGAEK